MQLLDTPTSFGVWADLLMELIYGTKEIASELGKILPDCFRKVLAKYIPHKIFVASETGNEQLPLLFGKTPQEEPLIYLCHGYSCLKPVYEVNQLIELNDEGNKS